VTVPARKTPDQALLTPAYAVSAQASAIAAAMTAGATLAQAAAGLGMSRSTARRRLRDAGYPALPTGRRPRRSVAGPAMIRAYRDGASYRECGRRAGMSAGQARRLLKAAGIPARRPGWRPAAPGATPAEIAAAYRAGASLAELARRYGFSVTTAVRRLDEAGQPRRPARPRVF
jgi:lambda repressor-like predicted transcriptional regulator